MEWLCSKGYRDFKLSQLKRMLLLISFVCLAMGVENMACMLTHIVFYIAFIMF